MMIGTLPLSILTRRTTVTTMLTTAALSTKKMSTMAISTRWSRTKTRTMQQQLLPQQTLFKRFFHPSPRRRRLPSSNHIQQNNKNRNNNNNNNNHYSNNQNNNNQKESRHNILAGFARGAAITLGSTLISCFLAIQVEATAHRFLFWLKPQLYVNVDQAHGLTPQQLYSVRQQYQPWRRLRPSQSQKWSCAESDDYSWDNQQEQTCSSLLGLETHGTVYNDSSSGTDVDNDDSSSSSTTTFWNKKVELSSSSRTAGWTTTTTKWPNHHDYSRKWKQPQGEDVVTCSMTA